MKVVEYYINLNFLEILLLLFQFRLIKQNCKLIIYHQEWDTEIDDPRIIKIDIDKEIPDVVKFRERTL
jgi:hypothetical protein